MSSALNSPILSPADINMLRRVLDTAGVYDLDTKWHLARRLRFSRLLLKAFGEGVTVESQLVDLTVRQIEVLHSSCFPEESNESSREIARWEDEGGQMIRPRGSSHSFAKKIESDGTWTIHHVFTGQPAAYGTWLMAGLTRSVADRALRTVNAHCPHHGS